MLDFFLFQRLPQGFTSGSVRDLWAHQELGVYSNLNITIGANGASRTFRIYSA